MRRRRTPRSSTKPLATGSGAAGARRAATAFAARIVAGALPAGERRQRQDVAGRLRRPPLCRARPITARRRAYCDSPSPGRERALFQLHHRAFADGHAAIHLRGDVEIVGGDDGGEARGAHQLAQRREHPLGCALIEIAGRLVGEQDARRIGDRARDRDALLLAAGQLRRPVRQAILRARDTTTARRRVRALPRLLRPRIICGSITFSTAENSGSRWWN